MIIRARSPLRISFSGGGTDIEPYKDEYGGCVLSTTINQYCNATLIPRNDKEIYIISHDYSLTVKYNIDEEPDGDLKLVKHVIKHLGVDKGFDLHIQSDAPVGSGLGSSSSLVVCLISLFQKWLNLSLNLYDTAKLAYDIERKDMGIKGGWQDQYASTFGGFNFIEFYPSKVIVNPLRIREDYLNELEHNLLLVYTGKTRKSENIITRQVDNYKKNKKYLHELKDITIDMKNYLLTGQLNDFGLMLKEAWENKKKLTSAISNPQIDEMYEEGLKSGAIGAKLCFTPDTLITTIDGEKNIKDILIGQKVFDVKNNIETVIDKFERQYDDDLIKIKIKGSPEIIKTTPEHPFMLTFKNIKLQRHNGKVANDIVFKEAKDLQKGDCLLEPINEHIVDFENIKLNDCVDYITPKASNVDPFLNIPDEIPLEYHFLNLIGWYVAEGSSSTQQINFALNKNEIVIAEEIQKCISLLFSRNSRIESNGTNGIRVVANSVILCNLFTNLCGKKAENKKLPNFIMFLPFKKQSVVLRALWQGDGCERITLDKRYNKTSVRCVYKTVSHLLAKQVQLLCHRLGYITTLRTPKIRPTSYCESPQQVYEVCIEGDDAVAFQKFIETGEIVSVVRRNKHKLSLRKDIVDIQGVKYIKRSIISLDKEYYSGSVYNLEVTNSHTYIANRVAVHNCGAGGSGFLLFYCEDKHKVATRMKEIGCSPIPFNFDSKGVTGWSINQ